MFKRHISNIFFILNSLFFSRHGLSTSCFASTRPIHRSLQHGLILSVFWSSNKHAVLTELSSIKVSKYLSSNFSAIKYSNNSSTSSSRNWSVMSVGCQISCWYCTYIRGGQMFGLSTGATRRQHWNLWDKHIGNFFVMLQKMIHKCL